MIFFLNPSPIFCMAKHPAMLRGTAREVGNSSGLLHSRYFNRQKRNKKERVHRFDVPSLFRAEDEAQTRDPQLGRLMLYQLSYFRKNIPYQSQPSPRGAVLATCFGICNSDRLFSFFQVGSDGFEPPKAYASRFTVCPIWPLW